jgi:hypothetical protein
MTAHVLSGGGLRTWAVSFNVDSNKRSFAVIYDYYLTGTELLQNVKSCVVVFLA